MMAVTIEPTTDDTDFEKLDDTEYPSPPEAADWYLIKMRGEPVAIVDGLLSVKARLHERLMGKPPTTRKEIRIYCEDLMYAANNLDELVL